jgi:hypothetical protein
MTPASGNAQILFSDDFQRSGPQYVYFDPGGWRPINGVLRSTGGNATPWWAPGNSGWIALGDPSWNSYQVDLDFRFPTDGGVFLFASHIQDDPDLAEQVGSGFVAVLRPSPGNFSIEARNRTCGWDASQGTIRTPPYESGWNHLTAQVTASALEVSVNGVVCMRFENPPCGVSPATFAIGSGQVDAGSALVEVDNLVVQGLQPVPAAPQTWGRIKVDRR